MFNTSSTMQSAKKGHVIMYPGDKMERAIRLIAGYIRQYSVNSDGMEVSIHIYQPGSILSLSNIIANNPVNNYFQCMSDCQYEYVDKADLLKMIESQPDFALKMLTKLSDATFKLAARIESLSYDNASTRTASALWYLAKVLGSDFALDDQSGTLIPVTQAELASFAALTRESVSRELAHLRNEEIISAHKGKPFVINTAKLQELVPGALK